MKAEGLSVIDFSELSGIRVNTIYRWLRRGNIPSPIYMKMLHDLTKGKVCKGDWK
jgi:predicted DNA-binding transcriptional regulator AlpA